MENGKRMVSDYTVLCAVNIGSREIILAENEQSANGERFLCCYGERNDIFEKFTECAVGGDYIDAALFFAERIKQDAERFREEVEKLDIPVTVITQTDCIPDHYKNDINGKIIAINPAILKPEYQRADRQLFLVTGGFGASANARGSAVFCKNLYDGKNTRYERMDVLGEVKPECMPHWAVNKATVLKHIQGNKLIFEYGGKHLRSRGVFVSIILQNLAQLKALFEKQWESIVGNCDEFLYLGGNEQSTHKYVSELLGKETIDTNTYGKSSGRSGNYSTNYQISGRELLTPDEVRMLDNRYAILFIRGELPVMDLKYDILRHPAVDLTADGKGGVYQHGKVTSNVATIEVQYLDPDTLPDTEVSETTYELLSDEDFNSETNNNTTTKLRR